MLDEGVEQGVFRPVDPLFFYFQLGGACDQLFSAQYQLRHVFNVDRISNALRRRFASHLYTVLLDGILLDPGQSRSARRGSEVRSEGRTSAALRSGCGPEARSTLQVPPGFGGSSSTARPLFTMKAYALFSCPGAVTGLSRCAPRKTAYPKMPDRNDPANMPILASD